MHVFLFCFDARFRSITKQYFRKSDGVILVYDVTSEITFRNVRAWMTSVRVSWTRRAKAIVVCLSSIVYVRETGIGRR